MIKKQNLFLIGAPKCGTTFLHDLLKQHKKICMCQIKEPFYFNDNEYFNKMEWYQGLFKHCKNEIYRGESSPTYSLTTYFPDIPSRIYEFNPDSKIIYLIREPFSRLKSVYKQTMSTGHWEHVKLYNKKMPINFHDAIFEYPTYIEATRYWTNLNNYRKYFPDSSIKVVFFEDLVTDPVNVIQAIFQFLEIEKNISIAINNAEKNTGKNKSIYNPWKSKLRTVIPKFILDVVPDSFKKGFFSILENIPLNPYYKVRKVKEPEFSEKDKKRIKSMLSYEVESIYHYMNINNDPWKFFED